jgi:hypothetical protein
MKPGIEMETNLENGITTSYREYILPTQELLAGSNQRA